MLYIAAILGKNPLLMIAPVVRYASWNGTSMFENIQMLPVSYHLMTPNCGPT
jgi:hypothetical protein